MTYHNSIRECDIGELAKLLYERRATHNPPVVLVGAGISMNSGGPSGFGLMKSVAKEYRVTIQDCIDAVKDDNKKSVDDVKGAEATPFFGDVEISEGDLNVAKRLCGYINNAIQVMDEDTIKENAELISSGAIDVMDEDEAKKISKLVPFLYSRVVSRRSTQELYGVFDKYLQYHRPSQGYEYFARLARKGYFEWIVSTNFDPLVEEALFASGLPSHDLIQFSRRLSAPDEIAYFIQSDFHLPRVKLLKIHGDLRSRHLDATEETIQKFADPYETKLKAALISLVAQRDFVVIGHGLNDKAINDIIDSAYNFNIDNKRRLNSFWVLSMNKKEASESDQLNKLTAFHKEGKTSGISILAKPSAEGCLKPKVDAKGKTEKYLFDDLMPALYLELAALENEMEFKDTKLLGAFDEIYFTCGMTANKNQLIRQVVAPAHLGTQENHPGISDDGPLILDEAVLGRQIAPIYFSSLNDALALQVLNKGLQRNRATADVWPIMCDSPIISAPFYRDIYIYAKSDWSVPDGHEPCAFEKGVRTLSYWLHVAWMNKKPVPQGENVVGNKRALQIYLDTDLPASERQFFEKQNYKEMGAQNDNNEMYTLICGLETRVLLAGHAEHTEVVLDKEKADIIISHNKEASNIGEFSCKKEISIHRFVPVLTASSDLTSLLGGYVIQKCGASIGKSLRDTMFLTAGGPEHNKLLELFIALHRWSGGDVIMNQSNAFDEVDLKKSTSAVSLYNEAFVGGVAERTIGGTKSSEERKRGGWGAFITQFSMGIDWLPGKLAHKPIANRKVQVVSVVGLSAVGSVLGLAYVSYYPGYVVNKSDVRLLDVPVNPLALVLGGVTEKESEFIKGYIQYLTGNKNVEGRVKGFPDTPYAQAIRLLLSPVENEIRDLMKSHDIQLDNLSPYDTHARLWALLAHRYLIKQP